MTTDLDSNDSGDDLSSSSRDDDAKSTSENDEEEPKDNKEMLQNDRLRPTDNEEKQQDERKKFSTPGVPPENMISDDEASDKELWIRRLTRSRFLEPKRPVIAPRDPASRTGHAAVPKVSQKPSKEPLLKTEPPVSADSAQEVKD
jgi:hypothetical protein